MQKTLGMDTGGTAAPCRPEGYPTAHGLVFSNKAGGGGGGVPSLRAWLGIGQLVLSTCAPLHHLFCLGFSFLSLSQLAGF